MAVAASALASRAPRGLSLVPAVAVESLSAGAGESLALDGVSLEVAPGEIHVLLGPAGAGKTTLLHVLAGVRAAHGGRVTVLGEPAGYPASRSRVSLLTVERGFYERLSAEENLQFFARLHGMRKSRVRTRARELLLEAGLDAAARQPVGTYSDAMRARLSLARALLASPAVLLLDEGARGMEAEVTAHLRDAAGRLAAGGAAIVWATRRIDGVGGFADRATLLIGGRVAHAGGADALVAGADWSRYVLRLAGARRVAELQELLGRTARLTELGGGDVMLELRGGVLGEALSILAAAGARVRGCRPEALESDAAFLALAGRAKARAGG